MKKLLLHIGTGKTGSTTIQEVLAQLRNDKKLGDVAYPIIGNQKHHNRICTLVMPHSRIRRDIKSKFLKDDNKYRALVDKVHTQLDKGFKNNSNVIISGEYISGFNEEEISQLKSIINDYNFSEVKVVLYFREVCSLYLSQVQQRIKASSKFSNPFKYQFPYKKMYERWHKHFNNIEVRPFDRKLLVRGDVVADFLSVANKFFGSSIQAPDEVERTNESLTVAGMLVQHEYRKRFYPDDDNIMFNDSNRLVKIINRCEEQLGYQSKPRLKDSVRNYIRNNNKQSVDWLKSHLGIDFGDSSPIKPVKAGQFKARLSDILQIEDCDNKAKEALLFQIAHQLLNKK